MNFLQIKNKTSAAGALYMFGIILYFLISLLGGAVLSVLHCEGFIKTAISSLFAAAALGGVSLFSGKAYRSVFADRATGGDSDACGARFGLKEICGYKKFRAIYVLVAILIAAGIFAGFGFINTAFTNFLARLGAKIPQSEIIVNSLAEYAVLTLTLAVLPAITEESFFRGAIAFGFAGTNIFVGAAFSGLIFALYHCSLAQLLYQFVYGAFLYVLAVKAGSVIPCVIAHFLNNFAILTLTFFNVKVDLYSPVLIVCGFAALIVSAAILFLYERKTADREEIRNTGKGDKSGKERKPAAKEDKNGAVVKDFLLPFGIIGILACAATGILSVL